ncbi:uroporphyrinogen-III synthase [Qipengyuania sp. DGS5-3]|uniref:uroporphyrinogen-III synthase n=1 Tax=Qipengyuania sp. DGS5-3 TaxID=3349632 RepID=UPI0036D2949B
MTELVIIRPEPGGSQSLQAARKLGVPAQLFPLFEIEALDWEAPSPEGFDGLLIGSANAIRHAGPALASVASLPAYVVGKSTGVEAENAGLELAKVGSGGLQSLLDELPETPLRLLRLAGEERMALTLPQHVTQEERVLYRAKPVPMPEHCADILQKGAMIALHSAAAARHFCAECDREELDRSTISLIALGPRISEAAGTGWGAIHIAEQPNDAALLALAASLCKAGNSR